MYFRMVGGAGDVFPEGRRDQRHSHRVSNRKKVLPLSFSDKTEIPHSPSDHKEIPHSYSDRRYYPSASSLSTARLTSVSSWSAALL